MRELPIVVNPAAGGGRAVRMARAAVEALRARGVTAEVVESAVPGEATALTAAWVRRGAPVVAAAGGDGTMHEAAQALVGTDTALALLPFGRGNDLAAALGIPTTVAGAVAVLVEGRRRRIDVARVGGRVACTVVSTGFDAEVASRCRMGWWRHLGWLAYPVAAVTSLARLRPTPMVIEGDFGRREGHYVLAAISNTGIYGGGIRVAPDSSPDDGRLDCCLIRHMPRPKLVLLMLAAYRGRHVGFAEVEVVRSRSVRVTADGLSVIADGESVGHAPFECHLEPGALQVLVPREAH